jgi:hypothetical protein
MAGRLYIVREREATIFTGGLGGGSKSQVRGVSRDRGVHKGDTAGSYTLGGQQGSGGVYIQG